VATGAGAGAGAGAAAAVVAEAVVAAGCCAQAARPKARATARPVVVRLRGIAGRMSQLLRICGTVKTGGAASGGRGPARIMCGF